MAHVHDVYDADPYFVIDADTRGIIDQSNVGTSLMQYDHNSERFTFEAPRYIDEHDMSLCNRIEVHYLNIGANGKRSEGVYEVDDMIVDKDNDELVLFTWLVSQNATAHAGSLSFVIRFICSTDDNIEYIWNTAIYNKISVGTGMSSSEAVVTQYADVLHSWYVQLMAMGDSGLERIITATERALRDIEQAKDNMIDDLSKEEFVTDIIDVVTKAASENLDVDNITNNVFNELADKTVTQIDENSTDEQYASAKAVHTLFDTYSQEVNTLLDVIVNGEAAE